MEQVKISQNIALRLERARHLGFSDERILEIVRSGDMTGFQEIEDDDWSYEDFVQYAVANNEDLETAITDGYCMKFNTFNGVKLWLEYVTGLVADKDYFTGEGRILNIFLENDMYNLASGAIAPNWVFEHCLDDNGEVYDEAIETDIVLYKVWKEEYLY